MFKFNCREYKIRDFRLHDIRMINQNILRY